MNLAAITAAQQAIAQFDSHQNTLSGIALRAADRLSARSNPHHEDEEAVEGMIKKIEFADTAISTLRNYMIADMVLTPSVSAITSHVVNTNKNPSDLKTAATIVLPNLIGSFVGTMYMKHVFKGFMEDAGLLTPEVEEKIDNVSIMDMYRPENFRKVKEYYDIFENYESQFEEAHKRGVISNEEAAEAMKAAIGTFRSFVTVVLVLFGVSAVSSVGAAYHGYKRNNDSLGYALPWLFTGTSGLAVALTQGYAKPLNQKLIP